VFKEINFGGVIVGRDRRPAVVRAVINIWVSLTCGGFF